MNSENETEVGLLPVFTLVLWLVCLFVGLFGLRHSRPESPSTMPATEILDVEIANDIPAPQIVPAPRAQAAPALPQPFAIALPNPAIAFAQATKTSTPVLLKFGEGEGRQPTPEYPIEAALAHQQGTVVVTFNVDGNGRVINATATSPSPWPMLNQSALRTIRESWRFPTGPPRSYQVAIQFELNQ